MKRLLFAISIIFLCLLFSCQETPETPETPRTYKIIYHGNGSTSGFPPVDNNQYTSGSYATVLGKNTLKKDEYEFDGWDTSQDGSGTHYNTGEQIEIKNLDIFLHATWKTP
jgi:hypothetical protein